MQLEILKNRRSLLRLTQRTAAALLACTSIHAQTILHVDKDASPGGDGQSWGTAFDTLQDALAAVTPFTPTQVWVAQGAYTPDQGGGQTPGNQGARVRDAESGGDLRWLPR